MLTKRRFQRGFEGSIRGMGTLAGCVVVVGSSHVDFTVQLDRMPRLGETVIGKGFKVAPGGKGANQAVAASRLGAKVFIVSRVGRDYWGGFLRENFVKNDVSVEYLVEDEEEQTGVALILVDSEGRNIIAVAPGADRKVSREDVDRAERVFREAGAVALQLEIPIETVIYAAEKAWRHGVRVVLTPAPVHPLPEKLLEKVTVLTPNRVEAEELTGVKIRDLKDAATAGTILVERGVDNVVITLGERGAFLVNAERSVHIPPFKVKAVDTTGAGDAFSGALAVALAEGKNVDDSVRFANVAAAISTTKLGAQEALPERGEVEEALKLLGF
ncbi:MAG: ribokinase [Candidatus Freyarchaeota archaeon]